MTTKICPFQLAKAYYLENDPQQTLQGPPCIGDRCMAWRTKPVNRAHTEPGMGVGTLTELVGYCGMAGAPQ